jgi:hypothetical protein
MKTMMPLSQGIQEKISKTQRGTLSSNCDHNFFGDQNRKSKQHPDKGKHLLDFVL